MNELEKKAAAFGLLGCLLFEGLWHGAHPEGENPSPHAPEEPKPA